MPRTSHKRVQDVLAANYDDINCPTLTPFIKPANLIVTRLDSCAEDRGYDLSSDELTEIETWVAAYIYTINDPIYKTKQTANSSATFIDRSYLDAALALDPSKCLSAIMKGAAVQLAWLGKLDSEKYTYDERNGTQ